MFRIFSGEKHLKPFALAQERDFGILSTMTIFLQKFEKTFAISFPHLPYPIRRILASNIENGVLDMTCARRPSAVNREFKRPKDGL
ncbi:MAG: hypothetical protein SO023_10190 [Eubacterium sp.]|nr:hypothetical protein [Eubacterium sp.]